MNILPYFLKDVLKNKIKMQIESFSESLINDIIECLTNDNSSSKYVSIMAKVQENHKILITNTIKDIFESLDEQYKNSDYRKLIYNINKSNVYRTITTIFGDVSFKRTYYESKLDGSLHFVLDETLNLPKKDLYDPIVKGMAINTYAKTNQAIAGKIVGEQLTDIASLSINESIKTIPRQSVFNWINNWNTPKVKYQLKDTPKVIYIMSDEKFIGSQDLDNDIMIKSFVIFEGVKKVSKNRNELINKTVINMVSNKPWIDFTDILFQIYDSTKTDKIYLLGDGANWIKSGLAELKVEPSMEVKHLLCEFHFKQAIHHITTDNFERELLLLSFKDDSKTEFNNYINEIINNNPNRKDTIIKKQNYILNNYSSIKDMLNFNIGSSMESHISHFVANFFASRPKGFSSEYINKYLNINNYYNNNYNIFNLYINSYSNTESVTFDENKLNYSFFEKPHSSNIPSLNNGLNNNLNIYLNGIAHGCNF